MNDALKYLAVSVASLLLFASPARAQEVPIRWDTAGRFERALTIAPGGVAELCGKLRRGAVVNWRFDADAPLDFNVHYHVGREAVYPVRMAGAAKSADRFVAPKDQTYCWMWQRSTVDPVTVKAILQLRQGR
jgi:hypothetical protein